MNREELDAFFARADDVLTDWRGSHDAMVARAADEDAELWSADSYYEQSNIVFDIDFVVTREFLEQFAAAAIRASQALNRVGQNLSAAAAVTEAETPRDRALRLRRERNTGPTKRVGIDGHLRRRIR